MNLHRLQVFYAVARRLSYSRAAEEIYVSQPAVSKQVKELEREVGTPLLNRVGRQISLTDAGRTLYHYAQQIFALTQELERALQEMKEVERGYLRIGACTTVGTYLLPQPLALFKGRHPGIQLQVDIGNSQQVEEKVVRNQVDLGFVGARFTGGDLQVQPYLRDQLVVIASPRHPFARRGEASLLEMAEETFILREKGSGTRAALEEAFARQGLRARDYLELASTEAIKRAVSANLGISALSRYAISLEVRQGQLKTVSVPGLAIERELVLLTPKGIRPSTAALAFAAFVRKAPVEQGA